MTLPTREATYKTIAKRQRSMMRNWLEHDALLDGREALDTRCDLGPSCPHDRQALDARSWTRFAYCSILAAVEALEQYAVPYARILEQDRLEEAR